MNKLICPVCACPLKRTKNQKSLQCENRHLFDLARQGYVNLLLSHQKKSKHPGDNTEMVAARTEFLNRGYYSDIAQSMSALAVGLLQPQQTLPRLHYCDIGCGEGYYTEQLHQALIKAGASSNTHLTTSGVDISSAAIKAASKRNKDIQWLIASAAHLPMASASQDLVSCLFFHLNGSEAARILKPGAPLITVTAGPKHLIELRELLYDSIKPETGPESLLNVQQLAHIETQSLLKPFTLSTSEDITQLFTMTPHYWRTKPEKKRQLSSIKRLELTLDIRIHLYQRTESA